eukprot:8845006-Alexandrium_andersonii.AAC.1
MGQLCTGCSDCSEQDGAIWSKFLQAPRRFAQAPARARAGGAAVLPAPPGWRLQRCALEAPAGGCGVAL